MFRNACEVDVTLEAPYYANNTRNEPLALLNLYPFEQYVHMERCKSEYDEMLCRPGCRLILKLLICCQYTRGMYFSKYSLSPGGGNMAAGGKNKR